MRDLRYRGLQGMVGEDIVRVTITDDPTPCIGDDGFNSSTKSDFNSKAATATAPCALGGPRTTEAAIHVFLSPVNRPPSVNFKWDTMRTTLEDSVAIGAGGVLTVEDPDVRETAYYSAGGSKIEGPVTVDVIAASGRLSLGARGGLSFSVGEGISDPALRFSGGIDDVNKALESLSYRCSAMSGCDVGTHEILVSVDDNGFTGKGGALSADATLSIDVDLENE